MAHNCHFYVSTSNVMYVILVTQEMLSYTWDEIKQYFEAEQDHYGCT